MQREHLLELYPDMIFCEGHEDALLGIIEKAGDEPVACYSLQKIVETLCSRDGMTEDEAREFAIFNIMGAHVGERTPAFLIETSV